jgi:hypothetical protein
MIIAAGILLEEAESFVGSGPADAEGPGDNDGTEPRVRRIDVG